MSKKEPIEATFLGKATSYPQQYDPTILVAIPRLENRKLYGIKEQPEIFTGYDTWHLYELGFLTQKGLPVTGMLKMVYSSDNCYLVESKSLKLYFNSFNMSRWGDSREEGIQLVVAQVQQDLAEKLQTAVEVCFFDGEQQGVSDFNDYELLEELGKAEDVVFDEYREAPELLACESNSPFEIKIATHLLRSNCKITHQPDWGSAFIHIKAGKSIDKISLLKYLVSFRNENHFHEEVCEMIYKRLWDLLQPEILMVSCLFTRRGGLDICPARASKPEYLPATMGNVTVFDTKQLRQ